MQQDILIISVLFPAILLMMMNFGNRYSVPTNPIKRLHEAVISASVSSKNAEQFPLQISRFQFRLRLIGIIQSSAVISYLPMLGAMIATYFSLPDIACILFLGSILLMMGSMLLLNREIQITNGALNVHLSDLHERREWEQYLKSKRRRGTTTKT